MGDEERVVYVGGKTMEMSSLGVAFLSMVVQSVVDQLVCSVAWHERSFRPSPDGTLCATTRPEKREE